MGQLSFLRPSFKVYNKLLLPKAEGFMERQDTKLSFSLTSE